MRASPILFLFLTLFFINSAFAAPIPVIDPDKLSSEIFNSIAHAKFNEAANKIAETIGKPDAIQPMESALKILDGKKFDYGKKSSIGTSTEPYVKSSIIRILKMPDSSTIALRSR